MISIDELRPGQSFLLAENFPGSGQAIAEVVFLRSEGPALLFQVVYTTDKTAFTPGARIVRLAGSVRRWELKPLNLATVMP